MKASRSNVPRAIPTRLKRREMNFAAGCDVPMPQATSEPTKGMIQSRVRIPTTSGPPEESLHEPLAEHEEERDDEAHHDDRGVALHLTGLALAQPPARPDRLEADRVHGPVDHLAIEHVALDGDLHPAAADRVHDAVDHSAVEPVQASGDAIDDGPTERVVHVVDPITTAEHAIDERPAPCRRECLRGHQLRGLDGPGHGD